MAITNPDSLVRLQQLATFEGKLQIKYQGKTIDIDGITAKTVEGALAELKNAVSGSDITFEKLETANEGQLATYRFTKGTGASAQTMDINIAKDYVSNIIGIVDEDGEGNKGAYIKVNTAPVGEDPVYGYVDASGLVEYLTLGDQTGKVVTLAIDSATHTITADIADGAVTKAKLAQGVQDSLDKADTAYQKPATGIPAADLAQGVQDSLAKADTALQEHQSITGKADKTVPAAAGNLAALDAEGNLADSGKKVADFQPAGNYKTTQTAVEDPTADGNALAFIDTISQNANGEITVTKKNVKVATDDDIAEIFA